TGQPLVVTDAVVLLTDGQDTLQLPYIFNRQLYATRNFPIKPGRQYWLKVTTLSGLQAEATCTVPAKLNQSLSARLDSSTVNIDMQEREYIAELKWQDLPGQGDFYKVDAGLVLAGEVIASDTAYFPIEMATDPLASDYLADGRNFSVSSYSILSYPDLQKERRLLYLQTYLLTTDKPLYEYHRSLLRYQQANSFSDPVKLYSNVKGGFGVFGSYRRFSLQVAL
ncbi:MAG TPA: DUF4249 family protein, partial [Adhaeribacter sp.]|nr:DUF4249 family protein [Adhaeribacter sp.]